MADQTAIDGARSLVRRGWDHLRRERPLAARADWQRALLLAPGDPAADEALDQLARAADLPAAARKEYRLVSPAGDADRRRWDARFREAKLDDLDRAARAFADLVDDEPNDTAALYNLALCRAWQGRNLDAIAAFDRYVAAVAPVALDQAVGAWAIAEILRAGAGAESEADDLSFAATVPGVDLDDDPAVSFSHLRPVPIGPDAPVRDARIFEWLDRPMPPASADLSAADLPLVMATLVLRPDQCRLSSPDPGTLALALDRLGPWRDRAERTATPLPLPLLDAGLWTFRLPADLDLDARRPLTREALEHRLEDVWIHWPRHGLGGATPLDAARAAAEGDAIARAKLLAVVRIREQLGARTRSAELYGGYPFDRLRRRLGLPPDDAATIEPADLSCAGLAELAKLDPAKLESLALADAVASAIGLRDDALIARFAGALVAQGGKALARVPAPAMFAGLVRHALARQDEAGAIDWLARAADADPGHRDDYETWRAEIEVRAGDPEAAFRTYARLLDHTPDSARALDAAETLIDRGYPDFAQALAAQARELARTPAERAAAEGLLSALRDGLVGE